MVVDEQIDLLDLPVLEKAAECFRTLSHPIRLRIIQILLQKSYTVGELAKACEVPSHVASEHLRLLKDRGFLRSERQGRKIYYHAAESALADIMECIEKRYGNKK